MKQFLLSLIFVSALCAQTTTPNLQLQLPFHGQTNYDNLINGDFSILDSAYGLLVQPFMGVWNSSIIYVRGQEVVFQGILYRSLINNNVNNTPSSSPGQWTSEIVSVPNSCAANVVLAGPVSGAGAALACRSLVSTDLPLPTTINSSAVPSSVGLLATNGSAQLVVGTGHGIGGSVFCSTNSGSTTAYACPITPLFVPGDGDLFDFDADVTNTGAITLNIGASGAIAVKKWTGCTGTPPCNLIAGDIQANQPTWVYFDAGLNIYSEMSPMSNTLINGAAFPISATVVGSNSSGQPITATTEGNGSKIQLTNTSVTTNGDTVSYDGSGNVQDSGKQLPAGTIVGTTDTQTLTGKTFDTSGSGNVFKINGTQIGAVRGTTTGNNTVQLNNGVATTSGDIASFDANGNTQDSGIASTIVIVGSTAYITSNYTNATTSFTSVTGLSFNVSANTNYKVRCDLDYQTSVATAGIKIQWTGPASPTAVTYDMVVQVTGATSSSSTSTAFSTSLSEVGTPTITTNMPLTLTMTLINGANAGTIQLQAAATGTGTITIIPGSCALRK